MRRILACSAAALLFAACSDSTAPSVATTVTIVPGSVAFDALGATQVVRASVADQKGRAMTGVALTWTSSSTAANIVASGGDSAVVQALGNGAATLTASAGEATGTGQVQVAQVATSLQKVGGDDQSGGIGAPLGGQVQVQARDRLGAAVAGQAVTFTVSTGGGSVASATVVTGSDGTASTTWTLGAAGANTLTATLPGAPASQVVFNATAVTILAGRIGIVAGGFQAAMEGAAVPVAPSVRVEAPSGAAMPGVTVNFSVTSGGGQVTGGSAITNASGVATVTRWTLGPAAALNTLTASVSGMSAAPVVFRGAGCSGAGPAFEITVCITTAMTPSQRQVFQGSAARWSTIVKGDLQDAVGAIPENACGDGTPSANQTYDDLLVFAGVADIDGPGQVLGQAGPCFLRNTSSLPVIGVMEFDVADLNALEASGRLSAVILHEMGHVLGIGTLWSYLGLLQNPSTAGAPLDTYYTGVGGIAGFNAIGGNTYTGGQKVPVENTGGAGTMNGHWRESVLKNELMTGFLNSNVANPLSVLTARSLSDLGYVVDPAAADPFFLTLSVRADGGAPQPGLRLHDDLYTGPLYTLSRTGARTRIR
ncbi:MAG: hypothetical protein AVDCRST_MAG89-5194 [uncultured Gemmatimonadetes bacterium]|uniref:Big-1 domain-containing protein n=1 Tax=uncultured Gemmatimonadota bacterium TaxID=203437 RepID=A0A6J4N595_9BACT|nr:MAG: hypothetical protein AVDCRST_MAG89-5194 [uncultured Gemmatimonadota bacterium]